MAPSVSIVIPTFNGASYLRETLPALRAQEYDGDVEIVAIDSQSKDESVHLLEQYGARVHVIPQAEFGHGKTRNQGVQLAQGEVIVFLSQDALPAKQNLLKELVQTVQNPSIGAAYARQLARPDATPLEQYFHQALYPPKSRTSHAVTGKALALEDIFFSNVCSAARREICLKYPFKEDIIMSEDQYFARSLLQAGLKIIYNAQAQVVHSHHYDLKSLFKRNFDSGYSLRSLEQSSLQKRASQAIHFWSHEAIYLARRRQFGWLLYLPLYEATRIAALLLGGRAEVFPISLRKRLSQHSSFWKTKTNEL